MLSFSLLVGCPHPTPADNNVDWAAPPRLPAPVAGTYARVSVIPADPGVASVLGDRPTDASLAGAAAGLALAAAEGTGGLTRWELREALWRAGYAYPVDSAHGWSAPAESPAPEAVSQWAQGIGAADVGLVRARAPRGDAWVGIVAKPRVDVGTQPRKVELGGAVRLPVLAGTTLEVVDGNGKHDAVPLDEPRSYTLATPGEWLFRVSDDRGIAALFPVYAGIDPPETALFPSPDRPPVSTAEARERALQLLAIARDAYGVRAYREDPLLQGAAKNVLAGGEPEMDWLGFETVDRWQCAAATVEDCLDSLLWEPRHRAALLGEEYRRIGVASELSSQSVRLCLLVASDRPPG